MNHDDALPQTSAETSGMVESRDTVTLSRAEYEQLRLHAASWLRGWATMADLVDREVADRIRAVSHDLSGAARWGNLGPSYAALKQLRDTPAWVRRCRHATCPRTNTVYTREQWSEPWLCSSHGSTGESAPIHDARRGPAGGQLPTGPIPEHSERRIFRLPEPEFDGLNGARAHLRLVSNRDGGDS